MDQRGKLKYSTIIRCETGKLWVVYTMSWVVLGAAGAKGTADSLGFRRGVVRRTTLAAQDIFLLVSLIFGEKTG